VAALVVAADDGVLPPTSKRSATARAAKCRSCQPMQTRIEQGRAQPERQGRSPNQQLVS